MAFIEPATAGSGRKSRQRAITRTLLELDTVHSYAARILDIYALSNPDERAAGRAWYEDARAHAVHLADKHGTTVRQAAGVIAALSPGCAWERNLQLADVMLASGDCGHPYGDAIGKARRIANGEDPNAVLRGRKVRSFYRNILYPATSAHVTIDRHALAIVTATELGARGGSNINPKVLEKPGAYQYIAAAYRIAARRVKLQPHQLQAVTWLTWRRLDYIPEF